MLASRSRRFPFLLLAVALLGTLLGTLHRAQAQGGGANDHAQNIEDTALPFEHADTVAADDPEDEPTTDTGRIDPEEMPPVAPMIPTGCNPPLEFLASEPRFSIFRTAIEETGLDAVFGNVRLRATILLPTNDAIKRTFAEQSKLEHGLSPEYLLTDYIALERLVRNHVLPMYNIPYEGFQEWGGCYDTMVEGTCLRVSLDDDGEVRLGSQASVRIDNDMRDMNGDCPTTMHAVDGLLLVDML